MAAGRAIRLGPLLGAPVQIVVVPQVYPLPLRVGANAPAMPFGHPLGTS